MVSGNWLLLSRLRRAVRKVRFLLSFNIHKWRRLLSIIQSPSSHLLSFRESPGLLDCTDDPTVHDCEMGSSPASIRRSPSDADDDIDRRAQIFIDNFHRHIRMERQVSLQLRYASGNGGLHRTCSD